MSRLDIFRRPGLILWPDFAKRNWLNISQSFDELREDAGAFSGIRNIAALVMAPLAIDSDGKGLRWVTLATRPRSRQRLSWRKR